MVNFRLLRPWPAHKSARNRSEPALALGRWRRSKRTLRRSLKGQLPSQPQLFQKGQPPIWKILLRSPSISMLYLALALQTRVWLRDRHMCVRSGCKVTRLSRKNNKAPGDVSLPAKYEDECNVSRSCWKETIAQTIYWRSRRSWKISVVSKKNLRKNRRRKRIRASLPERYSARGLPI